MPSAPAAPSLTPAAAWQLLASGNTRFVAGTPRYPHHSLWRRQDLAGGQSPFATVLSCSDSRVSPELAFDRGLGDVFVVRNAGHVLDQATLGTTEYGVSVVGTPLLAVMGHESCGAVAATMGAAQTGKMPGGYIGALVREMLPSAVAAGETGTTCAGEVMEEHVRQTIRNLLDRSEVVAAAVTRGECAIVGLTYRLADGTVSLLDWIGDLGRPRSASASEMRDLHEQTRAATDTADVMEAQQHAAASAAAAVVPAASHDIVEAQEVYVAGE